MIDAEVWNKWFRGEAAPEFRDLIAAMEEKFRCPRCGRADLPLALFPHHDKSCRFESGHLIDGSAIDIVEQKNQKIDDLEERIKILEAAVRDGIRTIQWFGRWLNGRSEPVTYDAVSCTCGHLPGQHQFSEQKCYAKVPDGEPFCTCVEYKPKSYSVSYAARDVAINVISMAKALGDSHAGHVPQVAKDVCKWCNPILAE